MRDVLFLYLFLTLLLLVTLNTNRYFRQSKLTSFQRQVNLYGFRRLTTGTDRGGYYHEMFLPGRADLHKKLVRIRVKGTGFKAASSPATEPDFYSYQSCIQEGPSQMKTRPVDVTSRAETADIIAVSPAADSVTSDPFVTLDDPVDPVWQPLSAPPKMVGSPLITPLRVTSLASFDDEKRPVGAFKPVGTNFRSSSILSLSSMAPTLARADQTSTFWQQQEPITVTPDSSLRQLLSTGLEQAMVMVSPAESPVHSSFPSMTSLSGISGDVGELLAAPLPQGAEDFRMDTFDADVEALLSMDTVFGEDEMLVDSTILSNKDDLPSEYSSCDPLLLLDEVVG